MLGCIWLAPKLTIGMPSAASTHFFAPVAQPDEDDNIPVNAVRKDDRTANLALTLSELPQNIQQIQNPSQIL